MKDELEISMTMSYYYWYMLLISTMPQHAESFIPSRILSYALSLSLSLSLSLCVSVFLGYVYAFSLARVSLQTLAPCPSPSSTAPTSLSPFIPRDRTHRKIRVSSASLRCHLAAIYLIRIIESTHAHILQSQP